MLSFKEELAINMISAFFVNAKNIGQLDNDELTKVVEAVQKFAWKIANEADRLRAINPLATPEYVQPYF